MISTIREVARFVRWRDWGPGKVTLLCSLCFYIATAYDLAFGGFAPTFAMFLIFASAQSALGFVLNDWGDRDLDRRQGKANVFNDRAPRTGVIGLILCLSAALVTGLPFVARPMFVPLWAAWMLMAAAYSLEPIRCKTRGALGLAVSFVAQWSLPVFIAFVAFERSGGTDMWALAIALTLSGATLELGHQRHDRVRDASACAATLAAGLPQSAMDRAYAVAVVLDKVAIGVTVAVVAFGLLPFRTWWALGMITAAGTVYLALLLGTLPTALRALTGGTVQDPYYATSPTMAHVLHETYPNAGLPMMLAFAATLRAPQYLTVLILFSLWRVVLSGADWQQPLRILRKWKAIR